MLDGNQVARDLYKTVKTLFPEFIPFLSEGDEENATITFVDLLDSLEKTNPSLENSDLVSRLDQFRDWVESYPRGEDAGNDLLTWYAVTFIEGVLERESLFRLGPAVIGKEDLLENKDYFSTWIGPAEYHRALNAFSDDNHSAPTISENND